jgi:hypothetical protein
MVPVKYDDELVSIVIPEPFVGDSQINIFALEPLVLVVGAISWMTVLLLFICNDPLLKYNVTPDVPEPVHVVHSSVEPLFTFTEPPK